MNVFPYACSNWYTNSTHDAHIRLFTEFDVFRASHLLVGHTLRNPRRSQLSPLRVDQPPTYTKSHTHTFKYTYKHTQTLALRFTSPYARTDRIGRVAATCRYLLRLHLTSSLSHAHISSLGSRQPRTIRRTRFIIACRGRFGGRPEKQRRCAFTFDDAPKNTRTQRTHERRNTQQSTYTL